MIVVLWGLMAGGWGAIKSQLCAVFRKLTQLTTTTTPAFHCHIVCLNLFCPLDDIGKPYQQMLFTMGE